MHLQREQITLEDIFTHKKFEPESLVPFPPTLSDTIKKPIKTFLGSDVDAENCHWNADQSYLLFKTQIEPIYRRSTKSKVYLFNPHNNEIDALNEQKVLHPSFSPDGKKLAYVLGNDLFVYCLESRQTTCVTNDGKWNYIINGNCDWVYEEEFAFSQAYQWSPNSALLAYYRFDESLVKEYAFPIYDDSYDTPYTYKYPKAGEKNAEVEIFCFHIEGQRRTKMPVNSNGGYIPKIVWTPENQLNIFHLNRHQNELNIWQCDPATNQCTTIYTEKNERYIDLTDDWYFLPQNQFVYTSEKDGFRNIYVHQHDGTTIPLTQNNFDISHIAAVDKQNHCIYYIVASPNPMERQLFVVNLEGQQQQLMEKSGWNEVYVNKDLDKIIIQNSNIREPATADQYAIVPNGNGTLPSLLFEKNILDNNKLKETLAQYGLQEPAFATIPIGNDEHLNSWVLLPQDFDAQKQYPVLFCNYGGPGSQTVMNKFGAVSMWHHYLSQKGFIVVSVDNIGTGFRGEDFKKRTYLQLGKLEIESQVQAAQYIARLPYVDAARIGHWGWSFGGFMSCLAITKGACLFSYAIAIASVTSWRYYDTIYTERYMRTPEENASGYDDNSPIAHLDNFKGKFLLIHGSADDNVHLQHSMQLSKLLIARNISFDMFIYPDKNHRITGGNTSLHLYHKVTDWLINKS